jgi:ABC-type transporter Mla subunit MlaD
MPFGTSFEGISAMPTNEEIWARIDKIATSVYIHEGRIDDHEQRIEELEKQHRQRIDEIDALLRLASATAQTVNVLANRINDYLRSIQDGGKRDGE